MTTTPLLAEMLLAKLIWCPPVSSHSAILSDQRSFHHLLVLFFLLILFVIK
jgi:hypothetical protein